MCCIYAYKLISLFKRGRLATRASTNSLKDAVDKRLSLLYGCFLFRTDLVVFSLGFCVPRATFALVPYAGGQGTEGAGRGLHSTCFVLDIRSFHSCIHHPSYNTSSTGLIVHPRPWSLCLRSLLLIEIWAVLVLLSIYCDLF